MQVLGRLLRCARSCASFRRLSLPPQTARGTVWTDGLDSEQERRRRGICGTLLALGVAASLAVTPLLALRTTTPTSAYVLLGSNCRFDPDNDDDGLGIGYDYVVNYNASRADSTRTAAARWNAGTTPQFTEVNYASSTRDVRVEFAYLGGMGPVATTTYWCGSGHYSQDPRIRWNLDVTQPTIAKQDVTGVHELGHTYGLDHNGTFNCTAWSAGLMYSPSAGIHDLCCWSWPTYDDLAGQVDAHNG